VLWSGLPVIFADFISYAFRWVTVTLDWPLFHT
jgi:hypothetical protein